MSEYNSSERRHVKELTKAAKLADAQRAEIIRGLMSLAPGRAWVLEHLESCHIFATTFTGNALQGAFLEGERSIGLRLLADIMVHCPDSYVQMMREKNDRDLANAARRSDPATLDGDGTDYTGAD